MQCAGPEANKVAIARRPPFIVRYRAVLPWRDRRLARAVLGSASEKSAPDHTLPHRQLAHPVAEPADIDREECVAGGEGLVRMLRRAAWCDDKQT